MGIPADLQELWRGLRYEVILVHINWANYRQLYGTSRKRFDVLMESASTFFENLHWILLDHVQLTLAKLEDREAMGRRKNMVLTALVSKVEAAGDNALAAELEKARDIVKDRCRAIRIRRNRRISHFDLAEMRRERTGLATGPSRNEIEEALQALRDFMNTIERHYCDNTTLYEHTVTQADGDMLLGMLARGLRYSELLRSGVIPQEDVQNVVERLRTEGVGA